MRAYGFDILPKLWEVKPEERVLPFETCLPIYSNGRAFPKIIELQSYSSGRQPMYGDRGSHPDRHLSYDKVRIEQQKGAFLEIIKANHGKGFPYIAAVAKKMIGARENLSGEFLRQLVEEGLVNLMDCPRLRQARVLTQFGVKGRTSAARYVRHE